MRIRKGDVFTFKSLDVLHDLQSRGEIKAGWSPAMDYLSIEQRQIISDRDVDYNNPITFCRMDGWTISTDMLVRLE
jgi:hypothetical protein